MTFALPFLLGLIISFIGTVPPSMLNMTTAKIAIQQTKKESLKFAWGVSLIILIQAYIAIFFAKYIHNNVAFQWYISIFSIIIFSILSLYFLREAKKEKEHGKTNRLITRNSFISGIILSSLNMFAIPFYCGISSALNMSGLVHFNQLSILSFVIGSFLGTFFLLYIYATYALKINQKARLLTKNLNYILSFITGFIAVITLIKIIPW